MLPASPESIEALFHYHCDTLETLKDNQESPTTGLLTECIEKTEKRIDVVLDLYKGLGYLAIKD